MRKVDGQAIIASLLQSFVDEGGFKEQDFLHGIHDMLVGDSHEQDEARKHIRCAIAVLNQEDAVHAKGK